MISRRSFLMGLGAAAAVAATGRTNLGVSSDSFEMLVIGDSLVWGQGLAEEEKFHALTKRWLRDEVLNGRAVNVTVRAHSGATIKLSERESRALAGNEPARRYHPEINVSFPTIEDQLKTAVRHYREPNAVKLVLLSGGLPEVGVGNILNPWGDSERLKVDITRYCYRHMSDLLAGTADAFPEALIAVVGYYPIITRHSPLKRIVNDILEVYNWPGWTKPLVNNPVNRILWRRFRRRMIKRSNIWYEHSKAELQRAVGDVNNLAGRQAAVYIPTGFAASNGYGTRDTYLWTVGKGGEAADRKRNERAEECRPALDVLREETDLKYRTRVCELASIGHPNPAGARAIATAIRETLGPVLTDVL